MTMIQQLAETSIEDLLKPRPVSVSADAKLIDVVDTMRDRYGAMLVQDGDKLVGIFTERDLMLRIDHKNQDWHAMPVSEVMTTTPRTLQRTATIGDAIAMMTNGLFRHIPIVNESGAVEGILSIRDILTYAVEHFPKEFINLPPSPRSEASGRWGG